MSKLSPKAKASRELAISQGLDTYTGRKCHRCHSYQKYLTGHCKQCSDSCGDSYYKRNREKVKERSRARYRADPIYQLLRNAKTRATHAGTEFSIDRENITIPDFCPVLGIPMTSPSIDRFDNSKGYTKDNVRVISKRANMLKSDATLDEMQRIVAYMEGKL